jgi:hypothetical protein
MALWGNQGDSSLFTVSEMSSKGGTESSSSARLLVDDTDSIYAHLEASLDTGASEVHMFNDNSGMELVSDLALVHYLLTSGRVAKVVLHLKPYPFFVSDAIPSDVDHTLDILANAEDANQRNIAQELSRFRFEGKLVLTTSGPINNFLASPEPMWCMPQVAREQLVPGPKDPGASKVALVICKGDLMYRKLLGDRTWDTDESFSDIVSYFPCAVVALRTCKSPLAVGLRPGQDRQVAEVSPEWMVNGEYGMVQFSVPPRPAVSLHVSDDSFQVAYDNT